MYALDKSMKKKNYYFSRQRKHQDNISSLMGQVLDGNKEIKAFNMSDNLNTYLKNYKKLWKKDYLKKRKYNDNFYVLVPTILGFGKIVIYLILIYLILNGRYDVATLVLVVGYYENIENEFERLSDKLDNVSSFSIMLDRIYNFKL